MKKKILKSTKAKIKNPKDNTREEAGGIIKDNTHWTKKRICLSLLVEQIYCKFRVLMLLLICSWCKFCSKVKVYFSARVA